MRSIPGLILLALVMMGCTDARRASPYGSLPGASVDDRESAEGAIDGQIERTDSSGALEEPEEDAGSVVAERDETFEEIQEDVEGGSQDSEYISDGSVDDDVEENEEDSETTEVIILSSGLQEKSILQEVESEKVMRSFLIHAPMGIDIQEKYPVVFFFHGDGGEPEDGVDFIGPLINMGEVVGVYPAGMSKSWNLGKEPSSADDVAFVELIIDELKNMSNLNLNALFAVGYSSGAGFCHKVAAETNHFKGIASMASVLLEETLVNGVLPVTTQPTRVFQVHGMQDDTCPYEGGNGTTGYTYVSVEDSAAAWASVNECQEPPDKEVTPEDNEKISYTNCLGFDVVSYGLPGVGHDIPLAVEGGLPSLIWEFFQQP